MSERAKVESIDAIKAFRAAMIKFAEKANVALADAEGELHRTMSWLESEKANYWKLQHRKRAEHVERCKEAVRMKQLYTDAAGHRSSAIDEQKALALARRALEEAEQKMQAVKSWRLRLEREIMLYKGSVQPLVTDVLVDVPMAATKLGRVLDALAAYVGYRPAGASDDETTEMPSMARPDTEAIATEAATFRTRTPTPQTRAAADPAAPGRVQFAGAPLDESEQFAAATLVIDREHVEPDQWLTIDLSIAGSPNLYLHRVERAFDGDTGWHIGSSDRSGAEPDAARLVRVSVGDLLELRPDLGEVLHLPVGTLAIVQGPALRGLFDARNEPRLTQ